MNAEDSEKENAADTKSDISEKKISVEIDYYIIRAYIIEEHKCRESENRKEEESSSGTEANEGSANRHKECEKIEECRQDKEILRDS